MNLSQTLLNQPQASAPGQAGLRALAVGLQVFCALPFATGAADLLIDVKVLTLSGAVIPPPVAVDPILNSEIKFWGAIWFGFGLILWYASRDLRQHAPLFRLLMGILVLSGLGRALSAVQFGAGSALMFSFMVFELTVPVALLVWHRWLLRQTSSALT